MPKIVAIRCVYNVVADCSIFIRSGVVASEIPRNSLKIQTYRVQGHPRSSIFLLATNSNFGRISYRFWEIDALSSKMACLTPPSSGTPLDIDVIYTPLKSTFNGLQFRHWQYRSIFIRLAVVAPKIAKSGEIPLKFDLTAVQGHPSGLGVDRKLTNDFLLVTNSTYLLLFSRYWRLKVENRWIFPPHPSLWWNLASEN